MPSFSSLVRNLLQRLCLAVKHFVLDVAHPYPISMRIFPGGESTVDAAVVNATLACTRLTNVTVLADPTERRSGETRAIIWLESEDDHELEIIGAFAICRYLARLWRLNPTTPTSALVVDSALEHLSSLMHSVEDNPHPSNVASCLHVFLERTNVEFCGHSLYIGGMQSMSLCDIMYRAAIEHALTILDATFREFYPEDDKNVPLHNWWNERADGPLRVSLEDDEDTTKEE